ncbi:hypothetical protein N0B44_16485 [Roseibacterium beibuensis]|uniref:hypothetical protein n=1 Tax=[Roseibacterium] beibuensis TaxID=1193142 RepID=UPI00217EABB7|nr:hypothetical protein [Roseibacterium beibuensis]MCS6624518.1 hypothetical protein [Roseibacterium beibuensis]
MGTADQAMRKSAAPERSGGDDDLSDVELVIRRARAGDLTENEAFEDIERIVLRRDPIDFYQKSWS